MFEFYVLGIHFLEKGRTLDSIGWKNEENDKRHMIWSCDGVTTITWYCRVGSFYSVYGDGLRGRRQLKADSVTTHIDVVTTKSVQERNPNSRRADDITTIRWRCHNPKSINYKFIFFIMLCATLEEFMPPDPRHFLAAF